MVVDRFEDTDGGRNPLGGHLDSRVQFDLCLVRIRRVGDAFRDILRVVALWRLARRKPLPGGEFGRNAIHAESPPVLAIRVPGHQVPSTARMHQAVRLHLANTWTSIATLIVELQLLVIATGSRDRRKSGSVDCRTAGHHRNDERMQCRDAAAQACGQYLLEFRQRAYGCFLYPGYRATGRSPQSDGYRDRLIVVEQ